MLTRIITAVIGIIVAVGVIIYGGGLFAFAVLGLSMLAWYELRTMAQTKGINIYLWSSGGAVLFLLSLCGWFLVNGVNYIALMLFLMMVVVTAILLITFEGLWRHCHNTEEHWLQGTAYSIFAFIYCGLLFAHVLFIRSVGGQDVYFIRSMEYGEAFLWLVLFGTWASDTFAYFVGITFGRHKFCSVSPKKSWEGAVGGFVGSVAVVVAIGQGILFMPTWQAMLIGLVIAFFAPVGDLVESVLKREFAVKDSGKILPGHGGILDRFDSLLFTAPLAYYTLLLTNLWK